jgi:hypothetical protein
MKKTIFSIHKDNANHIHKKQAIHFCKNKIPPLARRCCFDSLMKTCKIIRQKNQKSTFFPKIFIIFGKKA